MDQSQAPTDEISAPAQTGAIVPTGERYRTLKNGAIYDLEAGRIAANPPGGTTTAITQANAAAMATSRWDKVYSAARHGMRTASGSASSLRALSNMVEAQYKLAIDIEKGRASTEAARYVAQQAGYMPNERTNSVEMPGDGGVLALSMGAIVHIMSGILPILRNSGDNDE